MEKKEILDLISYEIRNRILNKQIDEIRYHYIDCKNKKYDCFYVMEFLALYKIDKLEKLNKISSETASNLRELLILRQKSRDLLGNEIVKTLEHQEDKALLDVLSHHIVLIDLELEKYHLFPVTEDLDYVIECLVKNENYDTKDNNGHKELIKAVKNFHKLNYCREKVLML